MMRIAAKDVVLQSTDIDLIETYLQPASLNPSGATLVELGCGAAMATRELAERHPETTIIGFEIDPIQHGKNKALGAPSNLEFRFGAAEKIALPTASVDAVLMLKSLHHVPVPSMDKALEEIARILRPGGLVYLSEPVYDGAFNEILRLFHDEQVVREAAFAAISRCVAHGTLLLEHEIHFLARSQFEGFSAFEERIIGATHTDFDIDSTLRDRIRAAFLQHCDDSGIADFLSPVRVDLLRKPA